MLFNGEFVDGIDLVTIFNWAFFAFFISLIFYLRREDRREGYPLESDTTGKEEDIGGLWLAPRKKFILPNDRGVIDLVSGPRDQRKLALKRTAVWPGAPFEPTGNPMRDGVGAAAYAERADLPDLTNDGENRIIPYRTDKAFEVAKEDADPRGMKVYGGDGKLAGEITDIWVDRAEAIVRYLEARVDTSMGSTKNILIPMTFAVINREKKRVNVEALYAKHFEDAPVTKSPDSVTRLEEDKICGYFGGGKFYASRARQEPIL